MAEERSENQSTETNAIIQLIVFKAGDEEFGIPIEEVREIIKKSVITAIPNSLKFIRGIINVRGEIVTTIDVKKRFSLPEKKNIEAKHVIVTKKDNNLFGLLVDEVIEVLRIQQKEIKEPPKLMASIHQKEMSGVVSHDNRLIILLNLEHILSQKELLAIADGKNKDNGKRNSKREVSL